MKNRSKSVFRAAGAIHQAVSRRRQHLNGVSLPERQWAGCVSALRRIRLATERGWHRAAAQLRSELLYQVDQCRTYMQQLSLELQELGSSNKCHNEADLFRELLALESEFDEVECDFEAKELCVTTPSVTLEGIHLGHFQIRLNWGQRENPLEYRIVALDANPAGSNDSVTHPHVSDEGLCEGDGRQAIRAALDAGRLADFFLLVGRILDTYSPGRAYIEMSEWFGPSCHECGTYVHEDDRCTCSRCDEVFCPECTSLCMHCDDVLCVSCVFRCQICAGTVCASCRDACATCRSIVCPHCLCDAQCTNCRDTPEEEEDTGESDAADRPPTDRIAASIRSSL